MPPKASREDRLKLALAIYLEKDDVKKVIAKITGFLYLKDGAALDFALLPVSAVKGQAPLTSAKDSALIPLLEELMNTIKPYREGGDFAVVIKRKGSDVPLFTMKHQSGKIEITQADMGITIVPDVGGIDLDFSLLETSFSSSEGVAAIKAQLEKVLRLGGMVYGKGSIVITIADKKCIYPFIERTEAMAKTEALVASYTKAFLELYLLLSKYTLFPGKIGSDFTHLGKVGNKEMEFLPASMHIIDKATDMQSKMALHFFDKPELKKEFFIAMEQMLVVAVDEFKAIGNVTIEIADQKYVFNFNPANYEKEATETMALKCKSEVGDFAAHKARLLKIMSDLFKQKGKITFQIGEAVTSEEFKPTPSEALVESLFAEIEALRKAKEEAGTGEVALTLMRELLPAELAPAPAKAGKPEADSAPLDLRRVIAEVKAHIAELTATKQALGAELSHRNGIIQEEKNKLNKVEAQIKDISAQLLKLTAVCEKEVASRRELETMLQTTATALEAVLASADIKARDELALEVERLKQEKDDVVAKLGRAQAKEKTLQGQIAQVEIKIADLTAKAQTAGDGKALLEQELLKAKTAQAQLQDAVKAALLSGDATLATSMGNLQRQFTDLIDKLEKKLDAANAKVNLAREELAKIKAENSALVEDLAAQDAEIEGLNLKVAQLEQDKGQLLMCIAQLQGQLAWAAENERALTRMLATARMEADTARAQAYVSAEAAKVHRSSAAVGMTYNAQGTAVPIYPLFLLPDHVPIFANGVWGQYRLPMLGQPPVILPLVDLLPGYIPAQDSKTGAWGQCALAAYYTVFTPAYYPESGSEGAAVALPFATATAPAGTHAEAAAGAGMD